MEIETTIYNQYGKPRIIRAEVTFRRGYAYSHPRNEQEFLDPGSADEISISSCRLAVGNKEREITVTDYIEKALFEQAQK